MSFNFKLTIEYDGTDFSGWQRQKDQVSVQGEIEKILSLILNQEIKISGSGRTDSGVHALAQTANFHAKTNLNPEQIKKGFNSLIKLPVVIHRCDIVDNDFHAQYNAVSKEYHYHILNRETPCAVNRQYQWHIREPLDIEVMKKCCCIIKGIHDFTSFENTGSPRSSSVREILYSEIFRENDNNVIFKIKGSGFLKYMVRNIIGTLVFAGIGKIDSIQFKKILEACDRTKAGPTAPPHGLFLYRVNYS